MLTFLIVGNEILVVGESAPPAPTAGYVTDAISDHIYCTDGGWIHNPGHNHCNNTMPLTLNDKPHLTLSARRIPS